jgi:glutamine amidotransferase
MMVIIDIGMGNVGSIQSMFDHIMVETRVSKDPEVIMKASKLVLPGVGAFDNAMKALDTAGLRSVLDEKVLNEKVPILGICLGMQLLTKRSEEGTLPGLGWLDAETVRFQNNNGFRVPHMGWNTVKVEKPSALFEGDEEKRFYFVHSYHVRCNDRQDVLTTTHYGIDFTSSVHHGNIYGVQYHPEKSHRFGMRLLSNFAGL